MEKQARGRVFSLQNVNFFGKLFLWMECKAFQKRGSGFISTPFLFLQIRRKKFLEMLGDFRLKNDIVAFVVYRINKAFFHNSAYNLILALGDLQSHVHP